MSLANASHENHPYSQYKGLQVQGCEENHEKPTAGNKGKNIALTALESPATRAWVNSCSEAAKSDSKAANGSASQWLQGTVQEQNVFWLDISLFQNLEKQKQQQQKSPTKYTVYSFENTAIWLPKFPNNKCLYFQLNWIDKSVIFSFPWN